jgi:DNA-directed RNA polymerase specialized sigma24 family protein
MPTRPSPTDDDDGSPQPLPLESTLRRRERRHVAAVLVCLPESERKVLEMAWFSCMSLTDIAARLDEPVPVVQAALASAMERLADLLLQAPERSA